MFARLKTSGKYQYLQIVENRKIQGKVVQRVIATIGRMDQLQQKDRIETLIRSLSRFSERVMLILSGKTDVSASSKKIGPALICERLWKELGIGAVIADLLSERKFEFDVERAIFLTVLHRLFASGSDRACERWRRDYVIEGVEGLQLHHLYRAMAFLGEELPDQRGATPFSPRCIKDLVEEGLFAANRDLFTNLDLVFFDTTSISFHGEGGQTLGEKGHSKDHRPDLNQMVVAAVIDEQGRPICCEMWPGNTADVTTLLPVVERLRGRFGIRQFCIVGDRGMISAKTVEALDEAEMPYILGARMRKVKNIREAVLSHPGRYREVHPEGNRCKDPSPLQVKEVVHDGRRYILCLNPRQARKDAQDRQAIIETLKEKLKTDPKSLIGNKGYRKYLKMKRGSLDFDRSKIDADSKFDGKWVLQTTADYPVDTVALKYKELWQVEQVFRDIKPLLETRPIFHRRDETIRGHVFCSFLALMLKKELDRRLQMAGHVFEWADIKQDLKALQEVVIDEQGKTLSIRTECLGTCGKVFQAVGVAVPPTIREL
jgi:transposase